MKKVFYNLLFIILFLTVCLHVNAADFRADYQVEYNLDDNLQSNLTNVKFNITITNFSNEVFVKQFAITFPKDFTIRNIRALDDNGVVAPEIQSDDLNTKIGLTFTNPVTGRDSVNHFYLDFTQDNIFKANGTAWEVILPTIANKADTTYKVIVNLPKGNSKKLSIAKPNPSYISDSQAVWDNPLTKTIYAVFGDKQTYKLDLTYHLKNPRIIPIETELALPPDTNLQKIFVEKLTPQPQSVYIDQDGNYMARYQLRPAENKLVTFTGFAQINSQSRSEVNTHYNRQPDLQYLKTTDKYWQLPNASFAKLKTSLDIYNFVTSTLSYDYGKRLPGNSRLGAKKILEDPSKAVCVEFTDLFIALARSKGIPARENEGYGFSQDPTFRPLSLISDVLHAWPEYYDSGKKTWVAIDPTWQNTSGIDYFSSFDLNHVVFVIHGKNSEYPLPAGMYKIENSKDVIIEPTTDLPVENNAIVVEAVDLPEKLSAKQHFAGKITVVNRGNVFAYGTTLSLAGREVKPSWQDKRIDILAPFQKKEIAVDLIGKNTVKKINGSLLLNVNGKPSYKQSIVVEPYYYSWGYNVAIVGGIILIPLTILIFLKKRK